MDESNHNSIMSFDYVASLQENLAKLVGDSPRPQWERCGTPGRDFGGTRLRIEIRMRE